MIESFEEPAIMYPNSKMVDDTIPIESLIDQTLSISDVSNLQSHYNITLFEIEFANKHILDFLRMELKSQHIFYSGASISLEYEAGIDIFLRQFKKIADRSLRN